jgi:diketogulonate reductase-like aldo/keto reductase
MNGKDVLNDSVVKEIAKAYGKTAAQVILRWHLQTGVITIPKSVTPSRIEENFDVFDFELTAEDMEKMTALDRNLRIGAVPSEFNKR